MPIMDFFPEILASEGPPLELRFRYDWTYVEDVAAEVQAALAAISALAALTRSDLLEY